MSDDVELVDEGCSWVVYVAGVRVATATRWSLAMRLVEYLRTPRGRMTLDPMPPLGGEVET